MFGKTGDAICNLHTAIDWNPLRRRIKIINRVLCTFGNLV